MNSLSTDVYQAKNSPLKIVEIILNYIEDKNMGGMSYGITEQFYPEEKTVGEVLYWLKDILKGREKEK